MKPSGSPWDQMTQKEKVESLHKTQERIRQAINRLHRLAYPKLKERMKR